MNRQRIHIHQLSRLAFAQVTDWDRILRELEASRKQMFWSYKPLRSGAVNLLRAEDASEVREIYDCVSQLAERAGGDKCAAANVKALQTFEAIFAPKILEPKNNYMEATAPGVDFAGAEIVGGPHFSIEDKIHRERFVYLHPSKNWKRDQTEAFCELLTVILEKRFGASARDLWFLDLRSGVRVMWPKSKPSIRSRCEQAARLLARVRDTNLEQESE